MAENREFPESKKPTSDAVLGLASPKDRSAAYILDVILLLPLVQILQSPLKKLMLESILYDKGAEVPTYRFLNFLVFVLLFVFYYTVAIWWKGQTLGKLFFGLRVISYHGVISLPQALLRSLFIFVELLLAGFPFLAIFSHPMRRPLHDRVADTLVISLKNPVGLPTKLEKWRAKVLVIAGSSIASLILLMSLLTGIVKTESTQALTLKERCQEMVDKTDNKTESLIELYLIDELPGNCLFEQSRDRVWLADKENDADEKLLAQFAIALALQEEGESSDIYLNEVCKSNPHHHLCDLSQWLLTSQENDDSAFAEFYRKIQDKKLYNFVRVFLADYLNGKKKYKETEQLLAPILDPGTLQPLVASVTFHSLLGQLKWDEAFWVYKTHGSVNDQSLLYFMQKELSQGQMSTRQQLQLLDYFYPHLSEQAHQRQPASISKVPAEIKDIYRILEGRL